MEERRGILAGVRVAAYTRDMSMDVAEDQAEVDAAWRSEIRRRIDDIESGKVELLDADEVHAQIRAKLDAMRK